MIKCPNCGADNRDSANFCKICRTRLLLPIVPKSPTLLGPQPSAGVPAPGPGSALVGPGVSPLPAVPLAAPSGFPKSWKSPQPIVEGRVMHIDAPVQEKAPIGGRLIAAGLLMLIKPVLALLLPSILPVTNTVRYMRVQDWQTGRERSVKMRGDPVGIISTGDWIAVWGKEEAGNIIMRAAYNYNTDAEIRLK